MKVLFIETMLIGHHIPYLTCLVDNNEYESVVITPEKNDNLSAKQYIYDIDFRNKNIWEYIKYLKFIKKVADEFKPDIIHFLDGDTIMRYFSLTFLYLLRYKIIITYHHFFEGWIRKISYKLMSKHNYVVVHTENIKRSLQNFNLKKVYHIEYPCFYSQNNHNDNIERKVVTLGAIGGTRYEKGLDILLKSLKEIKCDFRLIIAGIENDIKKEEINKLISSYNQKVILDLRFLTDEEFENYLNEIDIIVLPYRKSFNGASGPLTEGVSKGKMIIGPNHGSLYDIISENHIGKVFESENIKSLANTIEDAIINGFEYDEVAENYRNFLQPARFQNDYFNLYNAVINEEF